MKFGFSYNKVYAFITIVAMSGMVAYIVLPQLAFFGNLPWSYYAMVTIFLIFTFFDLNELPRTLEADDNRIRIRKYLGSQTFLRGEIESIRPLSDFDAKVKFIGVCYKVYINGASISSYNVTDKANIVVASVRKGFTVYRFAISCPTEEAAKNICKL